MSTPPDLSALRIDRDDRPPPRRRMPWWIVAIAALLGAAAIGWRAVSSLAILAPEVQVATAALERAGTPAAALLKANGYVIPRTKASVSAKLAGRLASLDVEEGDQVVKGQLLAELEHEDIAAQLAARAAALVEARARLAHAEALRDQAAQDLRRQESLSTAGVGSKSALDGAVAASRTTRASVAEAAAAVDTAGADLKVVEVMLEDARVRAPFAGTILRKEADVGESVAPAIASGQSTRGAIVTMADLSRLDVEADVSESNIARVVEGQPAEVEIDAVPDHVYRGRVRQILPTADRDKATVKVKVAIEDPDARIKPEMGARVTFLEAEPDPTALNAAPILTVPSAAIVVSGSSAHAWVVTEGNVSRRAVSVGASRGDRVEVASGLREGESVVLDPPPGLSEGAKIRTRR